jgi:Fe-S cluster assembly protein SufD
MRAEAAASGLRELRAEARARFDSAAWPTAEDEQWRRTDLSRFDLGPYIAERFGGLEGVQAGMVSSRSSSGPAACAGRIRFESGRCAALELGESLSGRGVRLETLATADARGDGLALGLLRSGFAASDDRVELLHFARLEYGAFLYLPPGLRVEEPFFADFEEGGDHRLATPHLAILLGEGSSATMISRLGEGLGTGVLCDSRIDVALGEASSLQLFELQSLGPSSLHFQRSRASLAAGSAFDRLEIQLGSRLAMTRSDCALEGRGASARLDGLLYRSRGQEADLGVSLRHLSPGAISRANYKCIVEGGGRSVFQGSIEVGDGASGTDAYLYNRNLLLGEAARADSIPTLRIGNNDVRCSHGSATGRLGEEEIFYLQCRGFSEAEARELLVLGFFEELLERAPPNFSEEALGGLLLRLAEAA